MAGPFSTSAELQMVDLGRCEYAEGQARMLSAVEARAEQQGPDQVLIVEFEPTLTVGRGEDPAAYQQTGLPVHAVSRGGKATYHGPGQIVAYPVLYLEPTARDLHAYLHALEEALIRTVAVFGLQGQRDERNTGCWVAGRKIASIGIAVRRWVTYHGLALNLSTDLSWFERFDPCGLDPDLMTSFERELGQAPARLQVRDELYRQLHAVLRAESE